MKYIIVVIAVLWLFLIYVTRVLAATISITGGQPSITSNDEYTVSVTLSVNNDTEYYLRGVFNKPDTDHYCGYTWNGSSWFKGPYSNGGWTNFLKITTKNNYWNGQLKAKIDLTDSACNGSGEYNFKIERFTQSGTENFDTQTEQRVQVTTPVASLVSITPAYSSTPAPSVSDTTAPTVTESISTEISVQPSPTAVPNSSSSNSDPSPTFPPSTVPLSGTTSVPQPTSSATPTEDLQPGNAGESSSTASGAVIADTPADTESVLGLQLEPTSSGLSNNTPGLPAKKGIPSVIWYLLFMGAVLLMAGCGIVLVQIKNKRPNHE